eukprot:7904401-Alexandrium_andersonii.AAC.1
MLATAWSTVPSCNRPFLNTGCAMIARESRSLITSTVKVVSLVSLEPLAHRAHQWRHSSAAEWTFCPARNAGAKTGM